MKAGFAAAALTAAWAAATAAAAQDAHAPAPPAPEAAPAPCCTVAKLTPVELEIAERVSSRSSKQGQLFAIRLAEPIVIDGHVVAPAGTAGVGEVIHADKGGGMGKAGELILAARYVEVEGRRVPLRSLKYGRSQGKDNSGAVASGSAVAGALLPAASLVAFLIKGGEVDVPAGTRAHAKVAEEVVLLPAQQPNGPSERRGD
jgi:hypothetical protein